VAGAALLALAVGVGAITYLNHTRPAALDLASVRAHPAAAPSPEDRLSLVCRRPSAPPGSRTAGVAGLWVIQPGSIAGYRAREQFATLTSPHEAVARTEQVRGWLLIGETGGGLQVETGCVAVEVRALRSVDEVPGFNTSDRDGNARSFLNAGAHPYAVFQPYPASLPLSASATAIQHARLAGDLEISGTTRPAQFELDVRLTGEEVTAAGSTTVQVGDFGVDVPQEAAGFVRVDPHITLEVSLLLRKS
jgi:hypothetical protein